VCWRRGVLELEESNQFTKEGKKTLARRVLYSYCTVEYLMKDGVMQPGEDMPSCFPGAGAY